MFWPAAEAAQVDYETLREIVLAGGEPLSIAAARFERRGLAGLIAWPTAEPVWSAVVLGAQRPPWTPQADPPVGILADTFETLLARGLPATPMQEAQ